MDASRDCPFDSERLTDYLMGEVSEADRRAVEEHLLDCETCRAEFRELRAAFEMISQAPAIEPAEGFAERIVSRAQLRGVDERRAVRVPRKRHVFDFGMRQPEGRFLPTVLLSPKWRVIAYAAGLVLVLFVMYETSPRTGSVPPSQAKGTVHVAVNESPKAEDTAVVPPNVAQHMPTELPSVPEMMPELEVPVEPMLGIEDVEPIPPQKPMARLVSPEMLIPIGPSERIQPRQWADAYRARTDPRLKRLWADFTGGSIDTQTAVVRALYWLARHQDADGKWDGVAFAKHCAKGQRCNDPAQSGSPIDNVGETAVVLLALLADGHTPDEGKFQAVSARGFSWLMAQQRADGCIGGGRGPNHALAAAALAELYGMTRELACRRAAQRAADFILASGGDKYRPNGDELTMAFEMMALRTGELSNLDVPAAAGAEARTAVARIPMPSGVLAAPYKLPRNAVTGPILSGMYLAGRAAPSGPATEDPDLLGAAGRLVNYPPEWKDGDTFYWFCGTAVMRQLVGSAPEKQPGWRAWNTALKRTLVDHQDIRGHEMGSWEPRGDLCRRAGRVFATALSTISLESYYRYVPPEH
jgi:hypothetical protein